jgi:hypothetical protein
VFVEWTTGWAAGPAIRPGGLPPTGRAGCNTRLDTREGAQQEQEVETATQGHQGNIPSARTSF